MKKLFSVLAVLLVLGTTSAFAKGKVTGIGAQGGIPTGGALTFKVSSMPCVFAVNFSSSESNTWIGATADWWVANPTISGPWCYFYGVGLYGGVNVGSNVTQIQFAPRALIGTNVYLIDGFLELYLQGGWEPMITVSNGFYPNFGGIFANAGFRFWF